METTIYHKIALIQKEIGKLVKDQNNPFYKSKYFDINSLVEQLQPHLEKHNLVLMQPVLEGKIITIIRDPETNEFLTSEMKLPELSDPQKMGSCITYYRRYTLQSLLALQAEDDDANKASGKVKAEEKPWLNPNTDNWTKAVNALKGDYTIEDIEKKYKLSKENKVQLLKDSVNV